MCLCQIPRRVDLRHIGLRMTKDHLGCLQAIPCTDHRRCRVPELQRLPPMLTPPLLQLTSLIGCQLPWFETGQQGMGEGAIASPNDRLTVCPPVIMIGVGVSGLCSATLGDLRWRWFRGPFSGPFCVVSKDYF